MTSRAQSKTPSGVVAFLFTDVEGSTALWAADDAAMSASLRVHDHIVRNSIEDGGGYIFTTAGDAFCAAFQRASDAVAVAQQIQTALGHATWPGPSLKVRIGVHLGEAEERGGDYFGPTVNIAARVESAGHGGQVLITEPVRTAANFVGAVDLGEHALKDVPERVRIFQAGDGQFPELRSAGGAGSNIPTTATRLVGRDADVRSVRLQLAEHSLVTLMGVGGTGKTRVAIEVADQELAHWRDGAWFVDLTRASTDADVARLLASTIGLEIRGDEVPKQVVDFLAGRSMLIVLDNCEHLIEACADLVEAILSSGSETKVLATSREWLDIDFEQVFQLSSLDTTDANSSAVQLFVQRARATDPNFAADEAGVVAEICRRLDGMPLAIELAAARVAILSPSGLLEGLDDRFQLLSGGRRRQRGRTLEATIDWSYDLLDEDERPFFRCLGVFLGSFDIAASATVGGVTQAEATDLLEALFSRSLLARSVEWPGRFQLLETLKAYAEDRLFDAGEAEATRERLHKHFAPTSTPSLALMSYPLSWWTSLEPDRANLAQVTDWLKTGKRWEELAAFVAHTGVSSHNPRHTLDLINECRPHLEDPDLDAELAQFHIRAAMQVSDWRQYIEVCVAETKRADPHYAGSAYLSLALPTATWDIDRAFTHIDRFVELPSRLDPDLKLMAEFGARESASATVGDAESTKVQAEKVLEISKRFGTDHLHAFMSMLSLGVCTWAAGNSHGHRIWIDKINELTTTPNEFQRSMIEFLVALAELADTPGNWKPVRTIAHRYGAGQVAQGESDAIVLLAILCEAEGNVEQSQYLIESPLNPRFPATHLAMYLLATRLGTFEEVRRLRLAEAADRTNINFALTKQTLQDELDRRGWVR